MFSFEHIEALKCYGDEVWSFWVMSQSKILLIRKMFKSKQILR